VTDDGNQKKLANTQNFVQSLRELDEPKLFKDLTMILNKLKVAESGDKRVNEHIEGIKKIFVAPLTDPKRDKKLALLQ